MSLISAFYFTEFVFLFVVFAGVTVLLVTVSLIRKSNTSAILWEWVLPLFGMSVAGLVVGLLTGNSRVPVVAALVPALLSLFAGYNVYLFSKNSSQKVTASLFTVVFSVFLVLGVSSGAENRYLEEEADRVYEQELERYRVDLELYKLRAMRAEGLGGLE
jgi:hypothetical protein